MASKLIDVTSSVISVGNTTSNHEVFLRNHPLCLIVLIFLLSLIDVQFVYTLIIFTFPCYIQPLISSFNSKYIKWKVRFKIHNHPTTKTPNRGYDIAVTLRLMSFNAGRNNKKCCFLMLVRFFYISNFLDIIREKNCLNLSNTKDNFLFITATNSSDFLWISPKFIWQETPFYCLCLSVCNSSAQACMRETKQVSTQRKINLQHFIFVSFCLFYRSRMLHPTFPIMEPFLSFL